MEALKVSARSNPNSVAGAMAGVLRRTRSVEVLVVGAAALNQAMKAVAIARSHVAADGIDAVCIPSFVDVDIEGESRTGILLRIEHRPASSVPAGMAATPVPGETSEGAAESEEPVVDLREVDLREERPAIVRPQDGPLTSGT